ncbi:MAG: pilus assembly protein, partial [Planctomycetota bacterium]
GRMAMVQQVITNAAREGARIAVLDDSTTGQVEARVKDYLNSGSVAGATIRVSPSPPSSAAYGAPVSVRVRVPFGNVSWLPVPAFVGNKTLQAESVMRRETVE